LAFSCHCDGKRRRVARVFPEVSFCILELGACRRQGRLCQALLKSAGKARQHCVSRSGGLAHVSQALPEASLDCPSMSFASETRRRRTFAIISHPDAGKTTLTEKLLLFSGAIQIAGSVKARKATRHATSDWMEIEKQRGISVASSVMQMLYRDH